MSTTDVHVCVLQPDLTNSMDMEIWNLPCKLDAADRAVSGRHLSNVVFCDAASHPHLPPLLLSCRLRHLQWKEGWTSEPLNSQASAESDCLSSPSAPEWHVETHPSVSKNEVQIHNILRCCCGTSHHREGEQHHIPVSSPIMAKAFKCHSTRGLHNSWISDVGCS